MKKMVAIICVLFVLSTCLAGCKQKPDLKVFNRWVTDNGFTPDLDKKAFLYKISEYTYLGKSLTPDSQFTDQLDKGETVGSSFWGLNSNKTTSDGTVHEYFYFYVRKNLDNLQFPGGVKIGDSKDSCLVKLDLKDKNANVSDIKIGNKTCKISFVENILIYTENYDWLLDNNKTSKVTRTVMLKFSNNVLNEVGITISEKYPE